MTTATLPSIAGERAAVEEIRDRAIEGVVRIGRAKGCCRPDPQDATPNLDLTPDA